MKPILQISLLASALAVVAPFLMLLPTQRVFQDFPPDHPKVKLPLASNAGRICDGAVSLVMTMSRTGTWILSGHGKVSESEIKNYFRQHVERCSALGIRSNLRLRLDDTLPAIHLREIILTAQREGVEKFTIASRSR